MTETDGKISAAQLYFICSVCRIMLLFTFISPQKTSFTPGDRFLIFIPFFLFEALLAIPVFLVIRKSDTVVSLAGSVSPAVSKVTGALYFAGLAWSAAVSASRFELFMSTVVFPEKTLTGFMLALTVTGVYIALKGIQTAGRCCAVIFVFTALSLGVIIASTAKDFDILNLTPPLSDGVAPVMQNGFYAAARTTELSALLFVKPKINGNLRKGFYVWLAAFGFFASALLGFISGVTGAYGDRSMFQLYTLTSLAVLGSGMKADGMLTAIWVLCSLFRTAFYILLCVEALNDSFCIKNKYVTFLFSGACIFTVCVFLSRSSAAFSWLLSSGINETLYIFYIGILPFILLAASCIKTRARKKRAGG